MDSSGSTGDADRSTLQAGSRRVASEVIAVPELPSGSVTFLFTDIEGRPELLSRGPRLDQAHGYEGW
jgi:hypothetical protein